jgi:hypothetical protein
MVIVIDANSEWRVANSKSQQLLFATRHSPFAFSQTKKEQGVSPAPKIVSTLFPRKVGFDLD